MHVKLLANEFLAVLDQGAIGEKKIGQNNDMVGISKEGYDIKD